jgi:hypothetical protein
MVILLHFIDYRISYIFTGKDIILKFVFKKKVKKVPCL